MNMTRVKTKLLRTFHVIIIDYFTLFEILIILLMSLILFFLSAEPIVMALPYKMQRTSVNLLESTCTRSSEFTPLPYPPVNLVFVQDYYTVSRITLLSPKLKENV